MRVIALKTLREFWERPGRADAEQPLKSWHDEAVAANWATPQDIKDRHRSASFVANSRVVFNIAGNKYRLVVAVNYPRQMCLIRFVGTHAEYDRINAEQI